jgi:hypothetical protein
VYGDLLLDGDGRIAYMPVNPDFRTVEFRSRDVTISADRLWHVKDATYRVKFTGFHWPAVVIGERENLIHLPGGGSPLVGRPPSAAAKASSSRQEKRDALQFWTDVVEGRLNPATLPVIYQAEA